MKDKDCNSNYHDYENFYPGDKLYTSNQIKPIINSVYNDRLEKEIKQEITEKLKVKLMFFFIDMAQLGGPGSVECLRTIRDVARVFDWDDIELEIQEYVRSILKSL